MERSSWWIAGVPTPISRADRRDGVRAVLSRAAARTGRATASTLESLIAARSERELGRDR